MGNHFLTEKQKEENCDHMWKKLKECVKEKEEGAINIVFPHAGIGFLDCKKYDSYNDFKNYAGYNVSFLQIENTIYNKNALKYYKVVPSTMKVTLEEDHNCFYFT